MKPKNCNDTVLRLLKSLIERIEKGDNVLEATFNSKTDVTDPFGPGCMGWLEINLYMENKGEKQ